MTTMITLESDIPFLLLCEVLRTGVAKVNGCNSHIRSIEREDGSGRCFNVYGTYDLSQEKFSKFIRTV